jgi:hypothetical protein
MSFTNMTVKKIDNLLASGKLTPEKRQELEAQRKQLLLNQKNDELRRGLLGKAKEEKPQLSE